MMNVFLSYPFLSLPLFVSLCFCSASNTVGCNTQGCPHRLHRQMSRGIVIQCTSASFEYIDSRRWACAWEITM